MTYKVECQRDGVWHEIPATRRLIMTEAFEEYRHWRFAIPCHAVRLVHTLDHTIIESVPIIDHSSMVKNAERSK